MERNCIPVIPGEHPVDYEGLLARFTATIAPCDIVEETWVRDIVDLTWEVMRLRRLKTSLLKGRAGGGMHDALRSIGAGEELAAAKGWLARDAQESRRAEAALAGAGLSLDTVMALTLTHQLRSVERIERMSEAAENRRNAALRHIMRTRAAFGEKARRAVRELEAVLSAVASGPALEPT
jgi:hypothetical protein